MKGQKEVINAAGRSIPQTANGKQLVPFMGVGAYQPDGLKKAPKIPSCSNFPSDGNKLVKSVKEALVKDRTYPSQL